MAAGVLFGAPPDAVQEMRAGGSFRLNPLGSGSDYTPFLQHLGIAALNIDYGGEDEYGQYHSIYDSFDHFVRFMDPTFEYGVTLAKTNGRTVMRLANADVLPFEFERSAATIARYADEVMKLPEDLRKETEERNRRLDDKVFQNVDDPTKTWFPPKRLDPVPYLNFAPLQNAVAALKKSAAAYGKAWSAATAGGKVPAPEVQGRLDQILLQDRARAHPQGGAAAPPLVHPPDLRPGLLHRLRRQDAPRHPRSPGAAQLAGGHGAGRHRLRRHRGVRPGDRPGHGGFGGSTGRKRRREVNWLVLGCRQISRG